MRQLLIGLTIVVVTIGGVLGAAAISAWRDTSAQRYTAAGGSAADDRDVVLTIEAVTDVGYVPNAEVSVATLAGVSTSMRTTPWRQHFGDLDHVTVTAQAQAESATISCTLTSGDTVLAKQESSSSDTSYATVICSF